MFFSRQKVTLIAVPEMNFPITAWGAGVRTRAASEKALRVITYHSSLFLKFVAKRSFAANLRK